MSDHFEIRKDAPLPTKRGKVSPYPFDKMAVGDSFTAPRDKGRKKNGVDGRQAAINSAAWIWAKRHNPTAKFSVRCIDDNTVGCWRVK